MKLMNCVTNDREGVIVSFIAKAGTNDILLLKSKMSQH